MQSARRLVVHTMLFLYSKLRPQIDLFAALQMLLSSAFAPFYFNFSPYFSCSFIGFVTGEWCRPNGDLLHKTSFTSKFAFLRITEFQLVSPLEADGCLRCSGWQVAMSLNDTDFSSYYNHDCGLYNNR